MNIELVSYESFHSHFRCYSWDGETSNAYIILFGGTFWKKSFFETGDLLVLLSCCTRVQTRPTVMYGTSQWTCRHHTTCVATVQLVPRLMAFGSVTSIYCNGEPRVVLAAVLGLIVVYFKSILPASIFRQTDVWFR